MRKTLKLKLLTFSFLLFSIQLSAMQFSTYPVKAFHGNTDNYVIAQDQIGNVFMGGAHGVSIMKEGKWLNYGEWVKEISHISTDNDGRTFVGNDVFFGVLIGDTIRDLSAEIDDELKFSKLNKIISTNTGNYFFVDQRILKLDQGIIDYNYGDISYAGKLNKDLIIQREGKGLFIFAGNNFRKINGSEAYSNQPLIDIVNLDNGQFLLIFQEDAILYDGDNFTPWTREGRDWIRKIRVDKVVGNSAGIFVSSESALFQLNQDGTFAQQIDLGLKVNSVYVDQDENLWISGENTTLVMMTSSPFKVLNALDESGTSILKSDDQLFLGTNRGAYVGSEFSFLKGGLPSKISAQSTNSFSLYAGQCFISNNKGLGLYDRGRITDVSSEEPSNGVILIDEQLLIEACFSGLNLYEKQYSNWKFLNHLYGIEEEVVSIVRDERERLWAHGVEKGVYLLNYDPVLRTINPILYQLGNLTADKINGIFLINGKPIVATKEGIFEFNEGLERFDESKIYNEKFGNRNNIQYLYQDELENIWYISLQESGFLRVVDRGVDKVTDKIVLPHLQAQLNIDFPGAYSLADGKLLLNGKDGFVLLDRSEINKEEEFQVHLFQITTFDKKGSTISNQWLLNGNTNRVLDLEKSTDMVELKFSSSVSNYDSLVYYSYNINDTGWSEITNNNVLRTKLQGGLNNIKVRASYGFSEKSNVLVIPLMVKEQWFMKELNQYLIIAGLATLFVFFLIMMFRLFKKRKKTIQALGEELENMKAEVTELKSKNEILSSQLITVHNDSDVIQQLQKLYRESDNVEIKKAIKKLSKKLDSNHSKVKDSLTPDPEFITRLKLKYPSLTKKDIKLCALLKMDLTTKDIAPILDITVRGVEISRYRLRKKLELGNDVILSEFLKAV